MNITNQRVCQLVFHAIVLWFLGASASTHAQIYKCVDESGTTQFSDKPCAKNAEEITVEVPASSGVSLGEQPNDAEKDARKLDREIKQLERTIARLESSFDKRIATLNKEFENAPNTSIGLYRKETILLEMKNLKTQYQMDVMPASTLLRTLKGKRSAIERRDLRVSVELPKENQSTENAGRK